MAVIGAGEMGRWLAKFSKRLGEVVVSDVDLAKAKRAATELKVKADSQERAVANSEIIFVAVPISSTPQVLKEVATLASKGALLIDVASVKLEVVKAMREIEQEVELVSIHPLFGPGASKVRNKDIVIIPVRTGKRYRKLKKFLISEGARIIETNAELHDQTMAVVQCLSHFVLLAYAKAFQSFNRGKLTGKMRTPIFSALASLVKAVLAGRPELYLEIQQQNKYAVQVRCSLLEAFHTLDASFTKGDLKNIKEILEGAIALFGEGEVKRAYRDLYRQFEKGGS
ncbi:MAG: prephenate dehydrogenase/arogenate dehydrogenase family protein [Candidatus Hadarchaeaceae archaeon]